MELEDESCEAEKGGGWSGQERAWSSGSESHSNSPYSRSGSGDWSSSGPPPRSRWRESRGYKTSSHHPPALPSLMEHSGPARGKVSEQGLAGLNDAQRKKLPSWIRAGLEKMEKDKQKKEQEDERRKRSSDKI